jgi:hypothetical protein
VSGTRSARPTGSIDRFYAHQLDDLIRTTNFSAIRMRPFNDICPTAYDGQEEVFVFTGHGRNERISSCESDIDEESRLFKLIQQIRDEVERDQNAVF